MSSSPVAGCRLFAEHLPLLESCGAGRRIAVRLGTATAGTSNRRSSRLRLPKQVELCVSVDGRHREAAVRRRDQKAFAVLLATAVGALAVAAR